MLIKLIIMVGEPSGCLFEWAQMGRTLSTLNGPTRKPINRSKSFPRNSDHSIPPPPLSLPPPFRRGRCRRRWVVSRGCGWLSEEEGWAVCDHYILGETMLPFNAMKITVIIFTRSYYAVCVKYLGVNPPPSFYLYVVILLDLNIVVSMLGSWYVSSFVKLMITNLLLQFTDF